VQLRNNRALLLSFALPLVLLYALFASFAAKRGVALGDPHYRVASALSLGMASIAILGYSMTVARDREKGVFQRLRVTPAPTWTIMASRLLVQVAAILAKVRGIVDLQFKRQSGTPVIATRRGAVPEVIEHGRSGIIVDDYRDMVSVLAQADELEPMELRRAAEERFSKGRMVADYVAAFEKAIAAA